MTEKRLTNTFIPQSMSEGVSRACCYTKSDCGVDEWIVNSICTIQQPTKEKRQMDTLSKRVCHHLAWGRYLVNIDIVEVYIERKLLLTLVVPAPF